MPYYSQSDNILSLPGDNISSLSLDGDSLWIGTREWLYVADVAHRKITRINMGSNTDVRCYIWARKREYCGLGQIPAWFD